MSKGWKQQDDKTSLACVLNGHRMCGSNCRRVLSKCGSDRGHCWTCNTTVAWTEEGDFMAINYIAYDKDGTMR